MRGGKDTEGRGGVGWGGGYDTREKRGRSRWEDWQGEKCLLWKMYERGTGGGHECESKQLEGEENKHTQCENGDAEKWPR